MSVVCVCIEWLIDMMFRVFANGLEDQGSIPGRVIPKTRKMVLVASLFNPQPYKVNIKDKWRNSGKGIPSSPSHR